MFKLFYISLYKYSNLEAVAPYRAIRAVFFCRSGLVGPYGSTRTIEAFGLTVANLWSTESKKELAEYFTRYRSSCLSLCAFRHMWQTMSNAIVISKNAPPATGAAA